MHSQIAATAQLLMLRKLARLNASVRVITSEEHFYTK